MKQTLILFSIVFYFSTTLLSQNLIAVEHGSSTSFYSRLDSAIAGASNGDNVYLPGGNFDVAGMVINKSINLIGVGYNTDSTAATGPSILIGNFTIINTAQGGSILGCRLLSQIIFGSNSSNSIINGYKIIRCFFAANSPINFYSNNSNNIIIQECILFSKENIYANGSSLHCYNNVFQGQISGLGENSVLKNNLLLNPAFNINLVYTLIYSRGITVDNNIFMSYNIWSPVQNRRSVFRNNVNIGYTTGIDGDTNTYQNNLNINCDSIFIDGGGNSSVSGCGKGFNETKNFRIRPNCIAKNAGTDGTDPGIYGGLYPWKEGGLPNTPHIQFKAIKGTTESDGKLKVNIKVKAQDN